MGNEPYFLTILFLIMPISINIVASTDQSESSVHASGSEVHLIESAERTAFKLNDKQLKKAVDKHKGRSPDDAYLRSPARKDDLYEKFDWEQVKTNLVVRKTEILSIETQPVIVKEQELVNNSSKTSTYSVSITETVTNTSTSSWSTGGTFTMGAGMEVGIKLAGIGASRSASLSYSQSWGVGGEHSEQIMVGSSSGIEVELKPGEGVKAILIANRGTMRVKITYGGYLTGRTAVNYDSKYKDHHFYGFKIDKVMEDSEISNEIVSYETIDIGYYSNSKTELRDLKTQKMLKTILL